MSGLRVMSGVLPLVLVLASPLAVAAGPALSPPAVTPPAGAQGGLDSGDINDEPLGGLVINRTMTVLGFDFYQSFSEVWQALHPHSKITLTVTERPTAQYGSEIWVSYRNQRVFHTFLSPARSGVRQASKEAVQVVYRNIMNIDAQRKLFKSADLGPEEM